jgi:DNA-binding Lrp family transcriptional regulator
LHNPADIAQLSDIQQRILASLDGPTSWDDLSRRTGLDAATLRAQATLLEIRGLATRTGPGLDRRHPHTA